MFYKGKETMSNESTYKEKCTQLKTWMPQILDTVKKDLKSEHLKNDFKFVKKYFAGKNLNKLTTEDFVEAYPSALENEENAEEVSEFIINRWLLKNTELYDYFEAALTKISPDFTELKEIDAKKSEEIIKGSVALFGSPRTYLFSIMNSVVFSKEVLEKLDKTAKEDLKKEQKDEAELKEKLSFESMKDHYEAQIARLTDKYEKKLAGLQRKYLVDTEGLKKQVVNLQKKLSV